MVERRICSVVVMRKVPNGFGSMEDRPTRCGSDTWTHEITEQILRGSPGHPGETIVQTVKRRTDAPVCGNGHPVGWR